MSEVHIIAIDPGTKRWGIAVGDLTTKTVFYLSVLESGLNENIKQLKNLLTKYQIKAIVVGYPTYLDGTRHSMTDFVDILCKEIEKFELPIKKIDERLSTFIVEKQLQTNCTVRKKRKHLVDKLAAKLILEDAFRENLFEDLIPSN